jgi:hypothetical protein
VSHNFGQKSPALSGWKARVPNVSSPPRQGGSESRVNRAADQSECTLSSIVCDFQNARVPLGDVAARQIPVIHFFFRDFYNLVCKISSGLVF